MSSVRSGRVRLHARTEHELQEAIQRAHLAYTVVSVSSSYPRRSGDGWSAYLDVTWSAPRPPGRVTRRPAY